MRITLPGSTNGSRSISLSDSSFAASDGRILPGVLKLNTGTKVVVVVGGAAVVVEGASVVVVALVVEGALVVVVASVVCTVVDGFDVTVDPTVVEPVRKAGSSLNGRS